MIRRPPRSTLFPTRRSSDLPIVILRAAPAQPRETEPPKPQAPPRSEEHTSELQSRQYLVCRLLLEKKKITFNVLVFLADPPALQFDIKHMQRCGNLT